MAGRGRGRGASLSFNVSQLGFAPGEKVPGPVLQPPPTYPTPENRPLPLDLGEAGEYLVLIKQNHAAYMREAPSFLEQVVVKRDVERYADRYQAATAKASSAGVGSINETYYPAELRRRVVRKKRKAQNGGSTPAKISKTVDINGRLEELEQREKAGVDVDEGDDDLAEGEEAKEDGEENDEDAEDVDEEDMDEEMDDGTDYINSYFDNGEDYGDDEDDNLDDGGTY